MITIRYLDGDVLPSDNQKSVTNNYKHGIPSLDSEYVLLSERAIELGKNVFHPIAKIGNETILPSGRPVMFNSSNSVGFLGIAGKDLCRIFHLLIMPKYTPATENLRWVFDLNDTHIPLLESMVKDGMAFMSANIKYFMNKKSMYTEEELGGIPYEEWLSKPKFGFHVKPSVGYIHMHMLVGPLTEFGWEYENNWVYLEDLLGSIDPIKKL